MWLSGLSAGLPTTGSPVRFPVRAHAWVVGQVPIGGVEEATTHGWFSPSLSLFPLYLKINKIKVIKVRIRINLGLRNTSREQNKRLNDMSCQENMSSNVSLGPARAQRRPCPGRWVPAPASPPLSQSGLDSRAVLAFAGQQESPGGTSRGPGAHRQESSTLP